MLPNAYYYDHPFSKQDLIENKHRNLVGGKWEEYGNFYLSLLLKYGLQPDSKFLDIGCGCFRGGIKIIEYLNFSKYYGIDVNSNLIKAGVEYELPKAGLKDKINKNNLIAVDNFELKNFNVKFDIAIAQSLFTHLPLNYLYYFLVKISPFFKVKSKLILSLWLSSEGKSIIDPIKWKFDDIIIETNFLKAPFHYKQSQIKSLINNPEISLLWDMVPLVNDKHPRNQSLFLFTKK